MTERELFQLESLLKKYRNEHTWTLPNQRRQGRDHYRVSADEVIHDVRNLRELGKFYDHPIFAVKKTA